MHMYMYVGSYRIKYSNTVYYTTVAFKLETVTSNDAI